MPIRDHDLDELLSPEQAAALLNVSRRTIYRMIHEKTLEVTYVGSGRGRARVTRRAIVDALHRRTAKPRTA